MSPKRRIWLKNNWFKIVVIGLLLKAVGENPYSYYQFLRWVVSLSSGYLAYSFFSSKRHVWVWIFGLITILFNPVEPFHFSKETWHILDVIVAVIYFFVLIKKGNYNE